MELGLFHDFLGIFLSEVKNMIFRKVRMSTELRKKYKNVYLR